MGFNCFVGCFGGLVLGVCVWVGFLVVFCGVCVGFCVGWGVGLVWGWGLLCDLGIGGYLVVFVLGRVGII